MAYSIQSAGYSPLFLMFGHKAWIPIDLIDGFHHQREAEPNEYIAGLQKTRSSAYEIVKDKMNVQHE